MSIGASRSRCRPGWGPRTTIGESGDRRSLGSPTSRSPTSLSLLGGHRLVIDADLRGVHRAAHVVIGDADRVAITHGVRCGDLATLLAALRAQTLADELRGA